MITWECSECGWPCQGVDSYSYSDCCDEPVSAVNPDVSGAVAANGLVYSDTEFDAPGF